MRKFLTRTKTRLSFFWRKHDMWLVALCALGISAAATTFFYHADTLVGYGDAESHLNISKRVVHSLTPGLAQLGGIWLPLPHLLMVPFVASDTLWRTGLAGAIVSGIAFVLSAVTLYGFVKSVTGKQVPGLVAAGVFMLNPNILYLQSTAMTEVVLIAFFLLSGYFFYTFLKNPENLLALILAAFFGLCATLSRYDGWFLVLAQASIVVFMHRWQLLSATGRRVVEGKVLLFSTLAFFGIALWLLWDWLILGDPLYFTSSPFSAKSQQQGWLARGELPTYHNLWLSVQYYSVTAVENIGWLVSTTAVLGVGLFIWARQEWRWLLAAVLFVPFVFYVVTLYMGQSVIFIPSLTPDTFEWQLFNVRYGVMMVPVAAFFFGYVFYRARFLAVKVVLVGVLAVQTVLFATGRQPAISYLDGVVGLSANTRSDAEVWLSANYDGGLVLMDDFARTISLVRAGLPMQNMIYIGTQPYWDDSLENPQRHARWIVMQEEDTVWNTLYEDLDKRAHVFTYYEQTYTSPTIVIFRRMDAFEQQLSRQ